MDTLIIFGAKYLFALVLLGTCGAFLLVKKEERTTFVVTAAMAAIVAVVLTKVAGALYFDPRPFTHGVHALIPHEADNGFPSDHTVLSVTAAAIAFAYNRKLGSALIALALLVGLCRVLSGIHSPLDIIAGALFGLIAAFVGFGAGKMWNSRKASRASA